MKEKDGPKTVPRPTKVTIYGACPSKSNCYKVVHLGEHASLAKKEALIAYEQSFFMQNTMRRARIAKRFKFTVDVYYKSDRPDLDNALKILLDCLQLSETIVNDRLCAEIHARKFIDRNNPRVEFSIEELM